jgi:LDH2 family malate/lactate/ureidoglycolate dehydrogenase
MAAAEGFVCLAYTNAQGAGKSVAPFGGLGRLIGTNPLAAAFPSPQGFPILLDFATSATAANKIRVAHTRHKPTGPGWIVDEQGHPTTDPKVFMDGKGNQLPVGGEQGHKGFGLAVMVDILGGILAGAGTATSSGKPLNNGTFLVCIDPTAFVARDTYEKELGELMDYLHAAPPAPGKAGVLLPGEYEHKNRLRMTQAGFEVEEEIWQSIVEAAQAVKVRAPVPAQPVRA